MERCNQRTEVYSRVVGYFRPIAQWNKGKQEEFKVRKEYDQPLVSDCDSKTPMVCVEEPQAELAVGVAGV